MKPFFSVIVPVYNVAPYLRECLDSLLRSAKKAVETEDVLIEFICINDGSTDGGDKILEEYASLFAAASHRIVYQFYSQTNKGLGATRNEGLDKAKGEWILFVDSDDAVDVDYFIAILTTIKKSNPSLIHFKHEAVYSLDISDKKRNPLCKEACLKNNAKSIYWILNAATAWNLCYRREIIGDIRFENITPGEDSLFNATILSKVKNVAVIPSALYYYLQRTNSLMHKKEISIAQIKSLITASRGRIQYTKNWEEYSKIKDDFYKFIRTTFIGQYGLMLCNTGINKKSAWDLYCDHGCEIYTATSDFIPFLSRILGTFIFKFRSYYSWKIFMFWPWKLRVALLKFSFVLYLKQKVRTAIK